MHEEMGDRRLTQFLHQLQTLARLSVPSDFLCTLWTNCLPPNIQALDDVARLEDKTAEVTLPPCVTCVSSSGDDISIVTARINQLAQQEAALSSRPSLPRSPSQMTARKMFTHCRMVTIP
jgi:hypothetical protein